MLLVLQGMDMDVFIIQEGLCGALLLEGKLRNKKEIEILFTSFAFCNCNIMSVIDNDKPSRQVLT